MPAAFYGLSNRIYALVALALIAAASLTFFTLNHASEAAYDLRTEELRHITDVGLSHIEAYSNRVEAGEMTLEEAKDAVYQILNDLRFGDNGYIYAFDSDIVYSVHPFRPQWVGGESQRNLKDVHGNKIFEAILGSMDSEGRSVSTIYFENPATKKVEPKLTYAQYYEPWDWYLGTGAYVNDIEADIARMRMRALAGLGVALAVLIGVSLLIIRSMLPPLNALKERMATMADGDLESDVPGLSDRSEIGQMAHAVANFRDGLQMQAALEAEAQLKDEERQRVVAILSQRLAKFAEGDLTVRVDDAMPEEFRQVAEDFNATVTQISDLMRKLVIGVERIESESEALDSSSRELGMRTETQAASLEETSAALTELSASVRNSAEESRAASERVQQASERTERGAQVVRKTIEAMRGIEESSAKISSITSLIDDISFQTSLLALNAGVEAARAGEAGRGFAVVAGEVRALAGKSSDAAREIADLIGNANREVETGVALARDSGTALDEINEHISAINETVSALAEAAREQSTGLSEITSAADQLDQVTQQNAAMFEETSAATQRLRDEANTLALNARQFQVSERDDDNVQRQAS
ncbi:methyl-accepting chemotaxis protein [Tritonibacter scottomollicae]|uniref:Methyl-accepting chemotaxis sensory transducer with Cache sensor n=1 Tax=Tritonibacter scottomollicae TaxID=483013 RepID=A0A2T1AA48_TRISK|nr:methyl-accepting chemotaxis protein [Tritonibacter scottomollicae]PRZ45476.1 methyl-accepting chemotaxis sensory transducer with Cache sensor [Tritonibacter scottomollicae]